MGRFVLAGEYPVAADYARTVVTASTIARLASRPTAYQSVIEVCRLLEEDEFNRRQLALYTQGLELAGPDWGYLDLLSVLQATSAAQQPTRYLEIGVRRGRSACVVASAAPDVEIYASDLWQADYAGSTNPGSTFVSAELDKVPHKGKRVFLDGDSRVTIPALFQRHPNLQFDLVTVDGDHSVRGARTDLENVVTRIAVGGVLVFDDCANPYCPGLDRVWKGFLGKHPELHGYTYDELPPGIGFAVRVR